MSKISNFKQTKNGKAYVNCPKNQIKVQREIERLNYDCFCGFLKKYIEFINGFPTRQVIVW